MQNHILASLDKIESTRVISLTLARLFLALIKQYACPVNNRTSARAEAILNILEHDLIDAKEDVLLEGMNNRSLTRFTTFI